MTWFLPPFQCEGELKMSETEIEAVARAIGSGGFRDEDGVWHPGVTQTDYKMACRAIAALDRVRADSARGGCGRDDCIAPDCMNPYCSRDSARGEDHEAGIEAALEAMLNGPLRAAGSVSVPTMRSWLEPAIAAYLAHVRPSPVDDTVRLREVYEAAVAWAHSGRPVTSGAENRLHDAVLKAEAALSVDAGKPEANDER